MTSAVLNALRGRSRSSRGAATDFSHGRKPVEIVSLGIQPRQGRKIRRENLTLLRSWKFRVAVNPTLARGATIYRRYAAWSHAFGGIRKLI